MAIKTNYLILFLKANMNRLTNNTLHHIKKLSILLVFALFVSSDFDQYDVPPVPDKQTSLYDYVNLLSPSQHQASEEKLVKYSDTTSTQIVVASISTTKGGNIGLLTAKWADEWGMGQAI